MESDVTPSTLSLADSYDEQILKKLRGLYSSCMDEERLDARGEQPLKHFVQTVRDLFRSEGTVIGVAHSQDEKKRNGLTAAIAYLHSRGEFLIIILRWHLIYILYRR